jgi:hypothetical protein
VFLQPLFSHKKIKANQILPLKAKDKKLEILDV